MSFQEYMHLLLMASLVVGFVGVVVSVIAVVLTFKADAEEKRRRDGR